jgi:hypothetical protein
MKITVKVSQILEKISSKRNPLLKNKTYNEKYIEQNCFSCSLKSVQTANISSFPEMAKYSQKIVYTMTVLKSCMFLFMFQEKAGLPGPVNL